MRIATFNINGIKARLPRLLEWLDETRPDVACLQEIKTSDETFPAKEIEEAGHGAIWHGQKGFNGVAILARGETPVLHAYASHEKTIALYRTLGFEVRAELPMRVLTQA